MTSQTDSATVNTSCVNYTAFATTMTLAACSAASIFAAVTTASTVATVAFAILGFCSVGFFGGSIVAWFNTDSTDDAKSYFKKVVSGTGYVMVGLSTLVIKKLVDIVLDVLRIVVTEFILDKCRKQRV